MPNETYFSVYVCTSIKSKARLIARESEKKEYCHFKYLILTAPKELHGRLNS